MTDRKESIVSRFMGMRTRLHGFIWALVGDYHEAEDIFQETSVVVLEKRAAYQEGTNFEAWVMEVARRTALDRRKRLARSRRDLPPEAAARLEAVFTSVPHEEELQRRREALRRCLRHLKPDGRSLVAARYLEGAPLADLASRLGRNVEAVRSLIRRLRKILFDCVSSSLGGEVSR